ncbi:hypothetical protein EKO27_g476 [Xylaria grammica]|uniref:Uncharacterized protein n=1 Tax=Xylaria grammica TaxID=363999 RepID=A0A439DJR7_9PEZI|nr:hypothetical protein EKO27_g476 [Xylaria grammica]
MAEMTLLHNASTLAAMCGAASATASAARDRRIADTYYRSPRSNFNAASYMNYLRAPVPSRVPSSHGVGIHIHYQGQCPHRMTHAMVARKTIAPHHTPITKDLPLRPLTSDIEKYKTTCQQLRETYVWNLRELVRRHQASPAKRARRKTASSKGYTSTTSAGFERYTTTTASTTDSCFVTSGELKTPVSSSRVPSPLSRDSGSRRSVATAWVNKGKEKEIVGADVDVGTPVESICDDSEGKETVMETSPITTPNKTTAKPQLKNNKISMQRRLRQLWPTKTNEKSPDKALLV